MHGWGRAFMTVRRTAACCRARPPRRSATLRFDNVRDRPLAEIWKNGEAFAAYRGTAWMPEPCASCERRETDWGGCRCQAFALPATPAPPIPRAN